LESVAKAMALLVRVGQASRAAEKAVDLQKARQAGAKDRAWTGSKWMNG